MSLDNEAPEPGDLITPPRTDEDIKVKIAEMKAALAEQEERIEAEKKQAALEIRANNEAAHRALEALRAGKPLQDEEI